MKIPLPALPAAAAAMLLSGCNTPLPKPVPAPGEASDQCHADKLGRFAGRTGDDATLTQVRAAAGHDRIRVIRPGMAVTMDFRADRLNVDIDENGRIRRLYCS